jgi:biopolymer transport protein TolR
VTVSADGTIYVQETPVQYENLVAHLEAVATAGYDQRIFIRGDENRAYGDVVRVMGRINAAGFRRIGLVTDQEQ